MLRKSINLFSYSFDSLLKFRHFIKLHCFRSPMSEKLSFLYLFYFYKAKFLYRFKNKYLLYSSYKKEAKDFNKNGFSFFTNSLIKKNCENILYKLEKSSFSWDNSNIFIGSPSDEFRKELINIFKNGVDEFIKQTFQSDYYIFYHILYKSKRLIKEKKEEGSQLWHADGGPGTCMNLMICHSPINKNNGAMKIINWRKSKKLLSKLYFEYKRLVRNNTFKFEDKQEKRLYLRKLKCEIIKGYIEDESVNYFQPNTNNSGAIFPFSNNCVHAGGYTELGYERIVSVMHIYPSIKKTSAM